MNTENEAPFEAKAAIWCLVLPLVIVLLPMIFGFHIPADRYILTAEGISFGQYAGASFMLAAAICLVIWIGYGLMTKKTIVIKAVILLLVILSLDIAISAFCSYSEASCIAILLDLSDVAFVFAAAYFMTSDEVKAWYQQTA